MGYVGLESLEALDAVMKSCVGWIKLEGLVGADDGALPASVVHVIVHFEHIVGRETTETVLVIGSRLRLKDGPLHKGQVSTLQHKQGR